MKEILSNSVVYDFSINYGAIDVNIYLICMNTS